MDELEKIQAQMLKNNMKQIQRAEKQLQKTQAEPKPKGLKRLLQKKGR